MGWRNQHKSDKLQQVHLHHSELIKITIYTVDATWVSRIDNSVNPDKAIQIPVSTKPNNIKKTK